MEKKLKIKLARPGALSVGPYKRGKVYEIEEKEARRLIDVKGFIEVKDEKEGENAAK